MNGISNKLSAKAERQENERIIGSYKPRGTHTLGPEFKTVEKRSK